MRYRRGLKSVKFVEYTIDRGVGDEMIDIVLLSGDLLGLIDKRGGASEGIVDVAYEFGIGKSLSSELSRTL